MVLEGMVPVLMHTPPTMDRASTTTTRLPNLAAATAARCPAGPEPITTRSYCCALMPISPRLNAVRVLAAAYCGDGSRLRSRLACLSSITVHGGHVRDMKTSLLHCATKRRLQKAATRSVEFFRKPEIQRATGV